MALPSSLVWEVRTTGNDANGGGFDPAVTSPGTDYSLQDSAQVAYTDLVIGATTTQLTSAAHAFTSAHVGNTVNVTGGTGFTAGWYGVRSVSGGVATMDRAVGTASSTGGTGNLGGAMASPGKVAGLKAVGNDTYVKSPGTYTCSATANVAGGRVNDTLGGGVSTSGRWIGYSTNRTPTNTDTKPVLAAGAASMTVVTLGGAYQQLINVEVSNPSAFASVTGVSVSGGTCTALRVKVGSCSTGFSLTGSGTRTVDCLAVASGAAGGFAYSANNGYFRGCVALGGTGVGFSFGNSFMVTLARCLAINNAAGGFSTLGGAPASFHECYAYGSTTSGADGFTLVSQCDLYGCVSYGNARYGYNLNTAANANSCRLVSCSGGGNGTADLANLAAVAEGFVTLTADPATNASGLDFSANATAGGGALLRAAGSPTAFPGLAGTSRPDIGPYQHADATGLARTPTMTTLGA